MDGFRGTWVVAYKALGKAREIQKKTSRLKESPSERVQRRHYLSTKYLNLRQPCKKLGPKYIDPFPIVQIINPVTVELQKPRSLRWVHPVILPTNLSQNGRANEQESPDQES